ncbi:MAG: family 16 glycosylhydrolase [Rikenellaceae bacterium]
MKHLFFPLSICALLMVSCGADNSKKVVLDEGVTLATATPANSKNLYVLDEKFSSEFEGAINNDNFVVGNRNWATWSNKTENVVVNDGNLEITARYEPHKSQRGADFYFTSGDIKTKELTTYGYFEARIKGADLWPGVCPAFWLYGGLKGGNDQNEEIGTITYSEIDIIELQQVPSSKNMLALNLHTGAILQNEEGKPYRQSLKAGIIPEICKTEFPVEWNPEDDYHVYACENRPDSVLFYIDGKRVGAKINYYWHMPMTLTVSMGMRNPYERYVAWDRYAVPATEEEAIEAGFPTTMYVDYVRSYTRDYSEFPSNKKLFDAEEANFDPAKIKAIIEKARKENI